MVEPFADSAILPSFAIREPPIGPGMKTKSTISLPVPRALAPGSTQEGFSRHAVASPGGRAAMQGIIKMKTITVTIKGTTALLQHRFNETAEQPGSARAVLVTRGTPREEAEKVCYRDAQGKFYFPGAAIGRLIREAGGGHKLKGTRKSAKYVVPAAVLVLDDAVTITNGDGKTPATDFEVDSRPVVIPATKRAVRHI